MNGDAQRKDFIVPEGITAERLDIFLTSKESQLSRHFAQNLIEEGFVYVNGMKTTRKSHRVNSGDKVGLLAYDLRKAEDPRPMSNAKLEIIYEDENIIAIDKPSGLTVHPGAGNRQNTLVNILLYYKKYHNLNLSDIQGLERPGIVHRLDRETSGIMIVAKNNESHLKLQALFKEQGIYKEYIALVYGKAERDFYIVDMPIGRDKKNRLKYSSNSLNPRSAKTEIRVIKRNNVYSIVRAFPVTGRTHQIRVHLKELNHPVVGDEIYSPRKTLKLKKYFHRQKSDLRLMLHSFKIKFIYPGREGEIILKSLLPADFLKCLKLLDNYNG